MQSTIEDAAINVHDLLNNSDERLQLKPSQVQPLEQDLSQLPQQIVKVKLLEGHNNTVSVSQA